MKITGKSKPVDIIKYLTPLTCANCKLHKQNSYNPL